MSGWHRWGLLHRLLLAWRRDQQVAETLAMKCQKVSERSTQRTHVPCLALHPPAHDIQPRAQCHPLQARRQTVSKAGSP